MGDEQKIEDQVAEIEISKTEAEKDKDFLREYHDLCQKHGRIIQVEPAFTLRDDMTYSVLIKTSVVKK